MGYFDSTSAPDECTLKCDDGQYPYVEFTTINNNENIITATVCLECDSACGSCIGSGIDECLSCSSSSEYLLIQNVE